MEFIFGTLYIHISTGNITAAGWLWTTPKSPSSHLPTLAQRWGRESAQMRKKYMDKEKKKKKKFVQQKQIRNSFTFPYGQVLSHFKESKAPACI